MTLTAKVSRVALALLFALLAGGTWQVFARLAGEPTQFLVATRARQLQALVKRQRGSAFVLSMIVCRCAMARAFPDHIADRSLPLEREHLAARSGTGI